MTLRPADVDLSTMLTGAYLANPVMTASGCAQVGRELAQFFDLSQVGAVVTPSVTRAPRPGGPGPRVVEAASGVLSSAGLAGPGIDAFLARDLPWLLQHEARPVVSIAGQSLEEYAELARRVGNTPGVAGIEVNVCSDLEGSGRAAAADPSQAGRVLSVARRDVPRGVGVFAKLPPDVTSIVELAWAVTDAGADGVVLVSPPAGMYLDLATMRPALGGGAGGLSGPAVRPLALRAVWEVAAALPQVPIVGVGGIRSGADALQFIAAGASAVQVGSAIFSDPTAPITICAELRAALAARGFADVRSAVRCAHRPGAEEKP